MYEILNIGKTADQPKFVICNRHFDPLDGEYQTYGEAEAKVKELQEKECSH